MIALVTLVVVFILALGMLSLGSSVRLSGRRQLSHSGALLMANAGVEYGYWQVRYNGATLPATFTYNQTTNGSPMKFTVTVTDNSANLAGTDKFVSTGTEDGESRTVTEVLQVAMLPTVFDYAACSNTSLISPGIPVVSGSNKKNGDIRCNGSISLTATGTAINGDATATGTVSVTGLTGTAHPNSPAINFPTISTSYYQGIANRTFATSQTWSGFTFLQPYEVVFVNGSVTINAGLISGTGTIVATGTITLAGNTSYALGSSKIAFLTPSGFYASTSSSVVGFYYCHNSSNNATISSASGATINVTNGSSAADIFYAMGTPVHDPSMNATLGKSLHLPGY